MVLFPPCKINLGLNILSKRPDGYHNIETCFFPVPWTDILEIIPSTHFSFLNSGIEIPGTEEDNLCLRAYHLLKRDFKIESVQVYLHKIIPLGAGLGGGSSDGAYTLRLLDQVFNLNQSVDQLKRYAAKLGSDCSFFLKGKPQLGSGKGEILHDTSLTLKGKFLVIVKPDIHVPTGEAYGGVTPALSTISVKEIVERYPIDEWKNYLKNDFEKSVFMKYPKICELKEILYQDDAIYASMSGSGSAVYGIFNQRVQLEDKFPGCTYWSGEL